MKVKSKADLKRALAKILEIARREFAISEIASIAYEALERPSEDDLEEMLNEDRLRG